MCDPETFEINQPPSENIFTQLYLLSCLEMPLLTRISYNCTKITMLSLSNYAKKYGDT